MFEKPIDRDIKGVIKVGQKDEENIYQELNEYVVTDELKKHFSEFFNIYAKGTSIPTDDMGVWISGFFGSGKSHFLKILSYILNSQLEVEDRENPGSFRRPIDFFKEDNKIQDPVVIADMIKSSGVSTDVILFNIDSKSSNSSSEKDKILDVFIKVFNEMRGYCTEYPFLADFEKKLDSEGKYEEFKSVFKDINGEDWEIVRDDYYFIVDEIVESIVSIGFMSQDAAQNWSEKAEENFNISIEKFAEEVAEYCESKGKNHHVVFLVDEVGQYIGDDTKLMLNLQSITEDLGTKCQGKAWIIVTSQQNIDDLVDVKGQDFSKIQGRFKTRLSLSSANVDEVIRKRILAKNEVANNMLKAYYPQVEPILKNNFSFTESAEMKNYANADDFASIYPFIPYQFNLLQAVLTSIREHGASGKHLAEGERSMLAMFQHAAIEMMEKDEQSLVPFNVFYDALSQFIDHSHSSVIIKAGYNELLTDFDVYVLKSLFLIKYVKEIKANLDNITILMISHIDEDLPELRNKIVKSLVRLERETLIQKNGDIYSFLTNEEQDVNKEIKNVNVELGEILNKASDVIFYDIFKEKKYKYNNKYNFAFNKAIDNIDSGMHKNDIGLRIISPYYDFNVQSSAQTTLSESSEQEMIYNALRGLSQNNKEVILHLNNDFTVFKEIEESLQIEKYLQKNSTEIKEHLKIAKSEERLEKESRIVILLEKALKQADVYVNGSKVDIMEKNASERINDALGDLVSKVYHKLTYMDFSPDKSDIIATIKESSQETFAGVESKANNALNDLYAYVEMQSSNHIKPSMKSILNRFTSAPYGFIELDVEWLVAKLFSQKRIDLIMNSEIVSLKTHKADELFKFLDGKDFREKLLVEKREGIKRRDVKAVKILLKDVFNESISSDNDELIMDKFVVASDKKLNDINDCLTYYRTNEDYPGKDALIDARDLLLDVKSKKSINQFYSFVVEKEDEFLDMGDNTYSVIQFFTSSQKTYFDEAARNYKIYESNMNFISDMELIDIVNQIRDILRMTNPYSRIKDLPQLNDKFEEKHKEIIDKEKVTPRNDINNELNEVLAILDADYEFKDELNSKFRNDFENRFNNLSKKLTKANVISVIKGVSDEASILKDNCIIKINDFKKIKSQETGGGIVDPPAQPKSVELPIKFIAAQSKVKIESEEDLEMFLNQIKYEVKKRLDDDKIDIVNIRL